MCQPRGEATPCRDAHCRIVHVDDRDYPGFLRVIWHAHVKELTDLDMRHRKHLMSVVFAAEAALRELLKPDKINLASLGNQVPHLHWNVIARFADDAHFPDDPGCGPRVAARAAASPPRRAGAASAAGGTAAQQGRDGVISVAGSLLAVWR